MDGTIGAGESLRLAQLSADLGMSPTPVRESLARLEGEGLVVRLPMRGFRVAEPLSADDLALLFEARTVLEPAIARRAALMADADARALLRAVWESGTRAKVGQRFETYRTYLERSAEFHETVATIAGNRFLQDALDALPIHVQRFRLFGEEGVTDRDVALEEHRAILEAIEAGDGEGAARSMRLHVDRVGIRSRSDVVRAQD